MLVIYLYATHFVRDTPHRHLLAQNLKMIGLWILSLINTQISTFQINVELPRPCFSQQKLMIYTLYLLLLHQSSYNQAGPTGANRFSFYINLNI